MKISSVVLPDEGTSCCLPSFLAEFSGNMTSAPTLDQAQQKRPLRLQPSRGGQQKSVPKADYRQGAYYGIATATLMALQAPFSALAARKVAPWDFIAFTQIALVASIPLLLARPEARRDFVALLTTLRNWPKFVVLLAVGLGGLALYDIGLKNAHPIATAAVLNLSPFWAAVVAFVISRKRIPGSAMMFFGCFLFAFVGAMAIAWSADRPESSQADRRRPREHVAWPLVLRAADADLLRAQRHARLCVVLVLRGERGDQRELPGVGRSANSRGDGACASARRLTGHRVERRRRLTVADRNARFVGRRPVILSGGPDCDAQRQRLRDHVLPRHPRAFRAYYLALGALNSGSRILPYSGVFCRPGARHGAAAAVCSRFVRLGQRAADWRIVQLRCSRRSLTAVSRRSTFGRRAREDATLAVMHPGPTGSRLFEIFVSIHDGRQIFAEPIVARALG